NQYLHRPADPLGLSGGIAFLQSGGTVEQLAAFLAGSQEYFQIQGGGTNQGWEDALYQDALHRPIDSGTRTSIDAALDSGTSRTEIAAMVLSSEEYRGDLVDIFYMRFLDRTVDPLGLRNNLDALNGGFTDEQVIAGIVGEPVLSEFFNKTAP